MDNFTSFYAMESGYFAERNCAHTSREIAMQPAVWNELCGILAEKKGEIEAFMNKIGGPGKLRTVFAGAGSSAFVGDALSAFVAKSAGIRTESAHTTDIVSAPGSYLFPDVPTLLVSFARSGSSPESIGAVEYARQAVKNLYEITIVCDGASKLYNLAAQRGDGLILVMPESANDKGFAMTSSVSCMMLAGFVLFNLDKLDDIIKDISLLSKNVANSGRALTKTAVRWAKRDFDRVVYLGSGGQKHIAHEASLKMMELTNGAVNGSYESAAGFRHGPKSVVKDKTLTAHMISCDGFTARYDRDLLAEIYNQKKGNAVISIGGDDISLCDEAVPVPTEGYGAAADICTGLHALVFCQMLAMFKAIELGVPVDNPSPGGEVNRVVKGVTIYDAPPVIS